MNPKRNPSHELSEVWLTRNQQKIFNVLARAYPRRLSTDALIDALYADDPNGGPLTVLQVVRVQIMHMRKKLAPYGWTIPNNKSGNGQGEYCFYSLEPMADEKCVMRTIPSTVGHSTDEEPYAYIRMPRVSFIDGANDNRSRAAA